MREIQYREAVREAIIEEMDRDRKVFLIGEDIGIYGGAFKA
ncbi:MAG: alpha-ketoacid dehydrogenase subunit beta, partial [Actinobacteria bacterium]|nr:alpha-ketoacid dehydrogenase subunit beta [Actinomycetota bacterium]